MRTAALNPTLLAALIGAGALLFAGILGLIGVPISAQVTGAVAAGAERRKQQVTHESEAIGSLLRAWILMDLLRPAGEDSDAFRSALCDWRAALAEMAAYGNSTACTWLGAFVRGGSDASTPLGQRQLVETVFAVRLVEIGKHRVGPGDRAAIATLLFG